MPCMCGDTHCWSCGPAQGNSKCEFCGMWADDGCVNEKACAAAIRSMSKLYGPRYFDDELGEYKKAAWDIANAAYVKAGGKLENTKFGRAEIKAFARKLRGTR